MDRIGDPVNEAARLTEQAKARPRAVVASQRIVDRAAGDEGSRWRLLEPLLLRGRADPTVLAVPAWGRALSSRTRRWNV